MLEDIPDDKLEEELEPGDIPAIDQAEEDLALGDTVSEEELRAAIADFMPGEAIPENLTEDDLQNILEMQRLSLEVARVRTANQQLLQQAQQMGTVPAPGDVLLTRLNALADFVLNPVGRISFELEFENRMTGVLERTLQVATRNKLTGNGQGGPAVMPNLPPGFNPFKT